MPLSYNPCDLSSFEGPNVKHKDAKPSNIAAYKPSVEEKKYDPSQVTFAKMGEKKGFQGRIKGKDPGEKESGCCSVM